jgi:protein ImuA
VAPHAFGVERADAWLQGGLKGDGCHEYYADGAGNLASALSVALLMGARVSESKSSPLIWLCQKSTISPYGPGLAALGLDPAAITLLSLADERALLRAAHDAVRSGAAGTVMLELAGRQPLLDLTATRRLVLAAAETGTMVQIVRADAEPGPSVAHTRWQVASAPSRPLEADAPGHPAFDLLLLRHRGGRDGLHMILEWNRDSASFRERDAADAGAAGAAPLSGGASALVAGGARAHPQDRAA